MSFSNEVKNELAAALPGKKSQAQAELAALLSENVLKKSENESGYLVYRDENIFLSKKIFTFLKKYYNISFSVFAENGRKKKNSRKFYGICFPAGLKTDAFFSGLSFSGKKSDSFAWLRGQFLRTGSISDPKSSYHMEFNYKDEADADRTLKVLQALGVNAGKTMRKGSFSIYIKDGSVISDMLAGMGAGVSMMKFENERAMNETRGMINRRVNCEIGNLRKSTEAGLKQIESIKLIGRVIGLDNLPDGLKEIAELRINNPEASLQELGKMMDPPLGRSGVNHRLQKLLGISQNISVPQEEM